MARFSKKALVDELCEMRDALEQEHGFRPDDGWKRHECGGGSKLVAFGQHWQVLKIISAVKGGYIGAGHD